MPEEDERFSVAETCFLENGNITPGVSSFLVGKFFSPSMSIFNSGFFLILSSRYSISVSLKLAIMYAALREILFSSSNCATDWSKSS